VYKGEETGTNQKNNNARALSTQDLISWAYQIACGMDYLARRKVSRFLVQSEKNNEKQKQKLHDWVMFLSS
jgi:hypothetical protein